MNLTIARCLEGDTRRPHVKQIPRLAVGEPRNARNLKLGGAGGTTVEDPTGSVF